jgi:hypothetical protein
MEQMTDAQLNAFEQGQQIIELLSKSSNSMGNEKYLVQGILNGLIKEHRTLQASIVRTLLTSLTKWGKDADVFHNYDLRNEAAVKTVMKIVPIVQDNPIPFI